MKMMHIINIIYVLNKERKVNKHCLLYTSLWEETTTSDSEWYSYNDVSNGDRKENVNAPADDPLKGYKKVTPMVYLSLIHI